MEELTVIGALSKEGEYPRLPHGAGRAYPAHIVRVSCVGYDGALTNTLNESWYCSYKHAANAYKAAVSTLAQSYKHECEACYDFDLVPPSGLCVELCIRHSPDEDEDTIQELWYTPVN